MARQQLPNGNWIDPAKGDREYVQGYSSTNLAAVEERFWEEYESLKAVGPVVLGDESEQPDLWLRCRVVEGACTYYYWVAADAMKAWEQSA